MSGIEQTNELLGSAIEELTSMPAPYDAVQEVLIDRTDVSQAAEALIEPTQRLMGLNSELPNIWLNVVFLGAAGVRALGNVTEVIGGSSTTPELRAAANHLNSMVSANHELGEMDNKMEEVLQEAFGSLIRAGQALGQFAELRARASTLITTSREDQVAAVAELKKITLDL